MSGRLGPIEFPCDAPPYHIVQACGRIGLEAPEDVPWYRLRQYLSQQTGWQAVLHGQQWRALLGMSRPGKACRCGQALPSLEKATFTFLSGNEVSYILGQCRRCRTVYWDEA